MLGHERHIAKDMSNQTPHSTHAIELAGPHYSSPVQTARDYYDSQEVDHFYATVWGGEDIHIGVYQHETESIFEASRRTIEQIAKQIPQLDAKTRVLDLGSGYGGSARYLASVYGCHVTCLNLSEKQNRQNIARNRAQGLSLMVHVADGNFEEIALPDGRVDVIWSQDALLHSGDRRRVFAEVSRTLDRGGRFIFTDIMQSESCSSDVMEPILDRLHLASLSSLASYRQYATEVGLKEVQWRDLSPHISAHYTRILQELQARCDTLTQVCSEAYLDRVQTGFRHWIDAGRSGDLIWGICHFRKS